MIHSDRATDFLSQETSQYLLAKGIASSRTSRYNPKYNGQVEKLNGTLWKSIQVTLHCRNMENSEWEDILPDSLHSLRSLLCTATNTTPHEKLFSFQRKSTSGKSIPSWIKPGPVYVKNHLKRKTDPPVTPATLLHANPLYAHVRLPSGVETTVNISELAPNDVSPIENEITDRSVGPNEVLTENRVLESVDNCVVPEMPPLDQETSRDNVPETLNNGNKVVPNENHPRRSQRVRTVPKKFDDYITG